MQFASWDILARPQLEELALCSPSKGPYSPRKRISLFKIAIHLMIGIAKAISLVKGHGDVVTLKIAELETVGDKMRCDRAPPQFGICTRYRAVNHARAPKEDISLSQRRRIYFWSFRRKIVLNFVREVLIISLTKVAPGSIPVIAGTWHEMVGPRIGIKADALGVDIFERNPPRDQMPVWPRV